MSAVKFEIDRDDPALLHEQVAAQIRKAIADGEARPGNRPPPARHLAAVTGVKQTRRSVL
jgi:GntR family transcriptional regulator